MPDRGFRRLHPATILLQVFVHGKAFLAAIAATLASIFSKGSRHEASAIPSWWIQLAVASLGVLAIIPSLVKYLTYYYAIVDDAFVVRSGFIFRQVRTIPLERIQNINLKRNILQRFLKVTVLQIETASGKGVEAELSVVGNSEAEALADALQHVGSRDLADPDRDRDLVYQASYREILVAGATQNRAGHIVIFLLGLLQYVDDLIKVAAKQFQRYEGAVHQLLPNIASIILASSVALLFLLLIGWILSIVGSLVKDYGFTLRSSAGLLRLRHGMFTQVESAVPSRRVQALRIEQPILQRRLGYCQVYAESAGSYEDKSAGGSAKLCPLLVREKLASLCQLVFPTVDPDDVPWQKVSPLSIRRHFVRGAIWWIFLVGAGALAWRHEVAWLIPVALAYSAVAAWMRYRVYTFAQKDGFFFVRAGIWRRRTMIAPEDRVQAVTYHQSPFQRQLGLADLYLVTAGATSHGRLTIHDLVAEEAIAIQDRLMTRPFGGPVGGL